MGVKAGCSADDEANVLRRMSLRPLNAELSSGAGRLFVREQQMDAPLWMRGEYGHLPLDDKEERAFWSLGAVATWQRRE